MNTLALFTCLLVRGRSLSPATVSAYIDPSAMTYMIQLVAGVAIAAGAGFSFYLRKLKRRFSKGRSSRANLQSYAMDDDDDTGYGDYELEPAASQAQASPSSAPAAERVYAPEPVSLPDTPADPFDETGGEGGLAAENRELRRLLAEERKKVEELKRALHICTAPRK
ncbi:MAG: hypothetical protein K2M42_10975 [Oscillospiraceae bacterium]|nr:hypothetical protein [Oscillospiraceae bacterium]